MAFEIVALATLLAIAQARTTNDAYPSKPAYSSLSSTAKLPNSQTPSVPYSSHSAPAPPHTVAAPLPYAPQTYSYATASFSYASPAAYAAPTVTAEPSAPAHYDFGYAVDDPHTGDSKSQQESRRGDKVQGSYSLVDADGTKRIVEYTADDHNGFIAVVRKESTGVAVKTVSKVAPAAYAQPAPVAYSHPAPVTYAQPAPVTYAKPAPVAYAHPALVTYAQSAPITYAHPAPVVYAQEAPVVFAQPDLKVAGPIGYFVPSIGYTGAQNHQ